MKSPEGAASRRIERFLSRQYLLDPRFRFWYLVPHPDQDLRHASALQLYTPGILDTANVFAAAAHWPADIRELSADAEDVLVHRVLGHLDRRLLPVEFSAFEHIVNDRVRPFLCVLSTADTHEFVSRSIAPFRGAWLHISTESIADALPIDAVTPARLRDHARQAIRQFAPECPYPGFAEMVERILSEPVPAARTPLEGLEYRHGLTIANEIALRAFGFDLQQQATLVPNDPEAYVRASIESARLVQRARESLVSSERLPPANRLILTALSPAWSLRKTELDRAKLPPGTPPEALSVWRDVLRQEFHFFRGSTANVEALAQSEVVQGIFAARAREQQAYVASLSVHAAHDLTPVLRLEPRVNRVRDHLRDIGRCSRGSGKHRVFKLQKLIARLSDQLASQVHPDYLKLLSPASRRIDGLSLVSDLPLEWLPIGGLPLGLLFNTSRIPVNPGNLSFGQLLDHRTHELRQSQFREVLIVRSFGAADPLRGVLEKSLGAFLPEELPKVRLVDVDTPEQFIRAVNEYSGPIMIFDGHGSHDPEDETSPIIIGGQPMDVWRYRKELRLPPIVLLSACDTLPLDGAHGSSAVGFLNAGATTVLGTLLPIDAHPAGSFIARLLYRIVKLLPLAVKLGRVDWREFLAGLLRMHHVSEITHAALVRFGLDEHAFDAVQLTANLTINHGDPAWHQAVLEQMRRVFPAPWYAAHAGRHPLHQLTDAMKYVQLGHPERVQIVADAPDITPQDPAGGNAERA